MSQLYVGRESLVTDIFSMNTKKQYVSTLEDEISRRGSKKNLVSYQEQAEISNRVLDILRAFCIDDWQSEPHYQHQNYA